MRRVRSQFLQSVCRLPFVVRGRGVSGGAVASRSIGGSGAASGLLLALALAVVAVPLLAVPAFGAGGVAEVSSFDGSDSDAGAFESLGRVAVHEGPGTVYAIDNRGSGSVVDKFDLTGAATDFSALSSSSLDGNAVTAPDGPVTLSLGDDSDIAVDSSGTASDGRVYVLQEYGANSATAFVFDADGSYLHKIAVPGADTCGIAVDPGGDVWIADYNSMSVKEFDSAGAATGDSIDTSDQGNPCHMAFDSAGNLYVAGYNGTLDKYDASGAFVAEINTAFNRAVAVDLVTDHVFAISQLDGVTEYDATGAFVSGFGQDLAGPLGSAVHGSSATAYVSDSSDDKVHVFASVPPPGVTVDSVSDVGTTSATFDGTVTVPAPGFPTGYHFEYSSDGVHWSKVPDSDVSVGGGVAGDYPVSQQVTDLNPNTAYSVRLVATTGAEAASPVAVFTTDPLAPTTGPLTAAPDTHGVTFSARVTPNSQSTSYRFEWGTTTSYGQLAPGFFRQIGSGSAPMAVQETVTGLEPNTTYHYRLVAKNATGTTTSPDYAFQTLDDCNVAHQRCPELVSPADKGPVGNVDMVYPANAAFQASKDGNGMAYLVLNGDGTSTSGGDVIYAGKRSQDGWLRAQVTGPSLVGAPNPSGLITTYSGAPGRVQYFSPDLGCAVVSTVNPLTDDTPPASVDFGLSNLYRWNASDGSYTLITNRLPLNPSDDNTFAGTVAVGVSPDCERIVFSSSYSYIPGASGLYEWSNGVLSDAGTRPDGSASPISRAKMAAARHTAVSPGGRVFFTSTSNEGPNAGKQAVFVRKSPTETVDVSLPTSGPTTGAGYEAASSDGSHVFFLANYGIASTSSDGPTNGNCADLDSFTGISDKPCDLYDYNVETDELTDISAFNTAANPDGAVAQGVMAVSGDGSTVYFAARGRLVPGKGRTYAQNLQGTGYASVYRYRDAQLTYVGSIKKEDLDGFANSHALIRTADTWSSQTTSDGSDFLFTSRDDITGMNPDGADAAYVFSDETGVTECVSCPRDGSNVRLLPSSTTGNPLEASGSVGGARVPRALSEDGRVIVTSQDVLAPGAVEGDGTLVGSEAVGGPAQTNVYEWYRGQLSLVATGRVQFLGMSVDGRDVFVRSYSRLDPRDVDFVGDVYDFRSGGGFSPPVAPPDPCDPGAGQCQGPPGETPGGSGSPGSSKESGSGNAELPSRDALKLRVATPAAVRGVRARLAVRVPGQGVVRTSGKGLVGSSRVVGKAGAHRVTAKLSERGLKKLRRKGRVRVLVAVRFVPSTGDAAQTVRVPVTFKLAERAANNNRRGAK
jgi:hypothetical protein